MVQTWSGVTLSAGLGGLPGTVGAGEGAADLGADLVAPVPVPPAPLCAEGGQESEESWEVEIAHSHP